MASEETERDLITALGALEETRGQILRTVDGIERVQVQLNRAGLDVDQISGMAARGGDWTDDPDFSRLILEEVRADSREVGTALADIGITQEEVRGHLDASAENLVQAREALSAASARAEYGPEPEETTEAIREVHSRVVAAGEAVSVTRRGLQEVDVAVAAGKAHLSGSVDSPEAARSATTGAQLHTEDAMAAAVRSLDTLDEGRDRTTHSARDLEELASDLGKRPSASAAEDAAFGRTAADEGEPSMRGRRDDTPRRENGPASRGLGL